VEGLRLAVADSLFDDPHALIFEFEFVNMRRDPDWIQWCWNSCCNNSSQ
jgi:hypothetical protein